MICPKGTKLCLRRYSQFRRLWLRTHEVCRVEPGGASYDGHRGEARRFGTWWSEVSWPLVPFVCVLADQHLLNVNAVFTAGALTNSSPDIDVPYCSAWVVHCTNYGLSTKMENKGLQKDVDYV